MTASGADREQILAALRPLTDQPDVELQEIVELVASICGTPWSAIAMVEAVGDGLVIGHGFERAHTPGAITLGARCGGDADPAAGTSCEPVADDEARTTVVVDGLTRTVRFCASAPIRHPGGAVVARLVVLDESERGISETQVGALRLLANNVSEIIELRIRRAMDQVEPVDPEDEMARIAAEISHDMRAPLASIVANLELMRDALGPEPLDPAMAKMLERSDRAAGRLLRMLTAMMAFHHAGSIEARVPVDLNQVVTQLRRDLSPLLQGASIDCPPASLPEVMGDPDLIYSVVLNLFTNAIKFARSEVPLDLTVRAVVDDSMARITVHDNGIGVPPSLNGAVFAMFARGTRRQEGHGIGLATVRRIVRAHGGEVGLESDGATGSRVWFELPASPRLPGQRPGQRPGED